MRVCFELIMRSWLQICAVYFTTIYWLARRIGADSAKAEGSDDGESQGQIGIQACTAAACPACSQVYLASLENPRRHTQTQASFCCCQVLEAATAIAISAVICYVGSSYAAAVGSPGLTIPIVTAITGACDAVAAAYLMHPTRKQRSNTKSQEAVQLLGPGRRRSPLFCC